MKKTAFIAFLVILTAGVFAGEFEGAWVLAYDSDILHPGINRTSLEQYDLTMSSELNYFTGNVAGKKILITGETYSVGSDSIILIKKVSNNELMILVGKKKRPGLYDGVWYGSDGKSGNFNFVKK